MKRVAILAGLVLAGTGLGTLAATGLVPHRSPEMRPARPGPAEPGPPAMADDMALAEDGAPPMAADDIYTGARTYLPEEDTAAYDEGDPDGGIAEEPRFEERADDDTPTARTPVDRPRDAADAAAAAAADAAADASAAGA